MNLKRKRANEGSELSVNAKEHEEQQKVYKMKKAEKSEQKENNENIIKSRRV